MHQLYPFYGEAFENSIFGKEILFSSLFIIFIHGLIVNFGNFLVKNISNCNEIVHGITEKTHLIWKITSF